MRASGSNEVLCIAYTSRDIHPAGMRIDKLTVEAGQSLALGDLAFRTSSSVPIFVTEIAPSETKAGNFFVELAGEFAWRAQKLDDLFDYQCTVMRDWSVHVDPASGEDLLTVQGPDRIGGVYLSPKGRGFYGLLGNGASPRGFAFGGHHAKVPTEGVIFREWKIIVGEGKDAETVFERSV